MAGGVGQAVILRVDLLRSDAVDEERAANLLEFHKDQVY